MRSILWGKIVLYLSGMIIVFSLIMLLLVSVHAEEPSDEVWQAAREGLPQLRGVVPETDIVNYGFNSLDELSTATLGNPYKVYTVTTDTAKAVSDGASTFSALTDTGTWHFPIMVGTESRAIIVVIAFCRGMSPIVTPSRVATEH